MTDNPYPKMIDVDGSGKSVANPLYKVWQEGWAVGFVDCMSPQDLASLHRFCEQVRKTEVT